MEDKSGEAAALFSQLAGLLAGFSFAALIAIVTVRLTAKSTEQQLTVAYRPLTSAFLALVASSANYAVVRLEAPFSGRSVAVNSTAALGLLTAGALLLFSILVTLDSVEAARPDPTGNGGRAVRMVRRILVLAVPPLFPGMYVPLLQAQEGVAHGGGSLLHPLLAEIGIVTTLISGCAGVVLFVLRGRLDRGRVGRDLLSVPGVYVSVGSLLATGAFTVFMPPDGVLPDAVLLAELAVVMTVGALTASAAARFHAAQRIGVRETAER
ncbi:hypothetical protein LZ318_26010 [Saccharopolyspora indica]|uniref:hypothetical protein n=1 Tax=Saccharopolyspora indica TaxID=1229659 RepID=UPI0022EA6219|nr:hypothetical protein [Saccharopolyspora indica]MDA3646663.1 hypothetical protein [Saccharopolyspora indica]